MNAIPETLGSGSANMDDLLAVLDLEPTDTEVDLDAFWDEAAAPGSIESVASTLSLEEAQRQGVIEPEVLSFADATRQDPKDVEASADQSPADATTEEKGEQDGGLDNNSLYNEIEDLDSFWNNALLQEETSQPSQAFSYEEALRRGLISPKFDSD